MLALGGEEYSSYSFTTSALDGVSGQRHAPTALCPVERTPGTHCTEGWVGLRAGLDTETRGKILCLCQGSNPDRPVVQSVVKHYTDWATPAPMINKTGQANFKRQAWPASTTQLLTWPTTQCLYFRTPCRDVTSHIRLRINPTKHHFC
jgi:hypothetical protein